MFFGVRSGDQPAIAFAEESMVKLLERHGKSSESLESKLAEFLLGSVSLDAVAGQLAIAGSLVRRAGALGRSGVAHSSRAARAAAILKKAPAIR